MSADTRRLATLAVFLLLSAFTGIAIGVLAVAVPLYALELAATSAEVGLIRAAGGVGLLVAALPAGFAVDRFGARRMFHAGSLLMALAVLSFPFAGAPSVLALLVFVDGIARALQLNALTTAFYRALPGFGRRRVGWHRGALSLGLSFAGPLLGGALTVAAGFNMVFAAIIVLAALPNLLLHLIDVPASEKARAATSGALRDHLRRLPSLLRTPDVACSLATEALVTGTFTAFATFIIVLAVVDLQLGAFTASLLAGLEGAAYIVTVFAGGGVVHRAQRRNTSLAGIALAMPSLGALSATSSPVVLAAAAVTLGVGLAFLNLVATDRAATLAGDKGGVAALFMTASSVGGALGPALAGAVAIWGGTAAAFLAPLPLFVLLGIAVAPIHRMTPKNLEAGPP